MGNIFGSRKEYGIDKIVNLDQTDIIYLPKGSRVFNNARLTNQFQEKCREKLKIDMKRQLQQNLNLYIDFPCMLPNLCRTFDSTTRKELTSRFNANNTMSIAYIENPLNHQQYLPILPVFELIQKILKEMNLNYTVNFDRLDYNETVMMPENAVLLINIIQTEPRYWRKLAEPEFVSEDDDCIYTQI